MLCVANLEVANGSRLKNTGILDLSSSTSDSTPAARIRVLLVEGTNHPGRGDTGYYNIPMHVDYWRNALASLAEAHEIEELSVDHGNVVIDPAAINVTSIPASLLRKLRADPDDLENPGSMDVLFAKEGDQARGDIKTQIQAFADSLGPNDISVLIYTGHGVQIAGELNLLFANPLAPIVKDQVPRRVWQNAGCKSLLGQWLCVSYDEMKQMFEGKGRLSVHIIGACRVTRDPRFNFNESDAGDPAEARNDFLQQNPHRGSPANVVTLFGTVPGSSTYHIGDDAANAIGQSLEVDGLLDSVYMSRLKANASNSSFGGTPMFKYQTSYFQQRMVSALGNQCAAAHSESPTVLSWLNQAAGEKIVAMWGETKYIQTPALEWGDAAEAVALSSALHFDKEKCFDRLDFLRGDSS